MHTSSVFCEADALVIANKNVIRQPLQNNASDQYENSGNGFIRHVYRTAQVATFAKVWEMADPSREHPKPDLRKLYSIVLLAPKPPDQLL
jgi:hypothetical protein